MDRSSVNNYIQSLSCKRGSCLVRVNFDAVFGCSKHARYVSKETWIFENCSC